MEELKTTKLYWELPDEIEFQARVLRVSTPEGPLGGHAEGDRVILDRTLFYPEGGGQLGDTGVLFFQGKPIRVRDTQVEGEAVVHLLEAPTEISGEVTGRIDPERRRDHMAHHTAQHMLSRALLDEARAKTVSARLGSASCTIDLERSHVPESELARAEDAVTDAILRDLPVRAFFPTQEELQALDLRRAPKVATGVRVIEVEGFDLTPCGGTHVSRTGKIGTCKVTSVERYKGMTRVTFAAARRAIEDTRRKDRVLAELARDFTCGPEDVPLAVQKLRADLKTRGDQLASARGELIDFVARALLEEHPPSDSTRIELRREGDVGMLRALAGRLTQRPDVVAILRAPDPEGGEDYVVVQRGSAASFDCAAWLKSEIAARGGRGGGKPDRAEGRLGAPEQ